MLVTRDEPVKNTLVPQSRLRTYVRDCGQLRGDRATQRVGIQVKIC